MANQQTKKKKLQIKPNKIKIKQIKQAISNKERTLALHTQPNNKTIDRVSELSQVGCVSRTKCLKVDEWGNRISRSNGFRHK